MLEVIELQDVIKELIKKKKRLEVDLREAEERS